MNEVFIIILLSILFSFVFFSLSYILIRKLKINHPKDRSRIFAVLMTSILLIFIISINVIATPLNHQDLRNNSSKMLDMGNCSLLVVMDETQIENDNYQEEKNSLIHDCDINSCCEGECTYSFYQNILSLIIHNSEDIENIISRLIKTKTNSTIKSLNSEIPKNENLLYSALNNKERNEKQNHEESTIVFVFLIFNLILLFLCISYLVYSLIFSKKFIIRNVNAKKCNNSKILQMVNKLCREINIKIPKIYVFDGEPNAFILGYPISLFISKKLINYLSSEELEVAIRHELGHISNKDHLLKPLIQSLRIMFFYNPIIHILYYKIMKERELLADSKFINSKVDKIRFMEILLKINDLSKNQNIFSNKLFGSSSLLLVSKKMRKLGITDRYNQLFSVRKKKSFFTILICIIVILSNISMLVVAQNSLLKNNEEVDEKIKIDTYGEDLENCCNTQNIKTIYILRFIKGETHLLDIINLHDNSIIEKN